MRFFSLDLLLPSRDKKSKAKKAVLKEEKARAAIMKQAAEFAQWREDAGFSQKDLARALYDEENKRLRIIKIESGEIQPTYFEALKWQSVCAGKINDERGEQVEQAIKALEYTKQ